MRIAVTNHHCMIVGGTESYLNQVIPLLEQAGHLVKFFHEAEPIGTATPIYATDSSADWSKLASFLPDVIFNHGLASSAQEFELSDIAPVVHFAHNYHGTCISGEKTRKWPSPAACNRRFGIPCISQYLPRHCGGWNPFVMISDYQTQSARHSAMQRARVVVTGSHHMAGEYKRNGMSNIQVAPLFASPNRVQLPEPDLASFRILFAGRMTAIKGPEILAQAAALIRDRPVTLTLAGDGPDRARLQQRYPNANVPGWLSQQDLSAMAAQHHVFAMPSVWPEPFGLVGLELGLPVTAFRVGGIPDWLTDGDNGTLAEPPTPEAFAAALVRCAAIPNGRQRAHAAALRFTVEKHMEILLPILESACAS